MIVYISGKIKNNENYEQEFRQADIWLKHQGHLTINPANLDMVCSSLSYEQYMAIDYKLVEIADAIFMIHGWQKSKGACAELQYAKSLGKKIIYQDYFGRNKREQNETRNCD